ncbi:unnamed protein product, partial [Rotaria sp. Silwood2]
SSAEQISLHAYHIFIRIISPNNDEEEQDEEKEEENSNEDESSDDDSLHELTYQQEEAMETLSNVFRMLNMSPIHDQ